MHHASASHGVLPVVGLELASLGAELLDGTYI